MIPARTAVGLTDRDLSCLHSQTKPTLEQCPGVGRALLGREGLLGEGGSKQQVRDDESSLLHLENKEKIHKLQSKKVVVLWENCTKTVQGPGSTQQLAEAGNGAKVVGPEPPRLCRQGEGNKPQ